MTLRQVEKAGAHFSMELKRLTVESILDGCRSSPRQSGGNGEIEDQRQVRYDRVGGDVLE